MDIKTEKGRIFQSVPEIKDQALQLGIDLQVVEESLEMSGNSYSLAGTIRFLENNIEKKVRIKITNSQNKCLDLKREEFMYGLIRKINYPTPNVFISGETITGSRFMVREYIEGTQLRGVPGDITRVCMLTLNSFFCDLHMVSLDGFGLIEKNDGVWKGEAVDWVASLEAKARRSFDRMKQSNIPLKYELLDQLLLILSRNSNLLNINHKSILHGDAGLINFLGNEEGLTAVIDTEFALVGDPAYEFSDKVGEDRDYSIDFINKYLDRMGEKGAHINRESFLERGIVYSPFIVVDIIPNLWEAGNRAGVSYFVSILPNEIEKAKLI